jgi:coenzyme PQQ precursor peptide PqqA
LIRRGEGRSVGAALKRAAGPTNAFLCESVPETAGPTASRRRSAMWSKPAFVDLRIGFEVTLYVANR